MSLFKRRKAHQARKKHRKIPFDIYEQHIGIVGLGAAGKTVFLTSLIDHIRLDGFRERQGVSLTNFREHDRKAVAGNWFPYKLYRARIADECRWPAKTGTALHYVCNFRRTDWSIPIRLHFYDLPGERIADASMFARKFSAWSQHTLTALAENRAVEKDVKAYAEFCNDSENGAAAIAHRYKLLLGKLVKEYRTLITPSTYILDLDGSMIENEDEDLNIWAEKRAVGLGKDQEFAPLPESVFEARPDLVKEFDSVYRSYRNVVVKPLFSRLKKCHQLYILVDIPGLLSASTHKFNDAVALIEDLLESCAPTNRFLRRACDRLIPHRLGLRRIKRLGLVATKSDMVRRKESDRLKSLLREMARRHVNDLQIFGVHTNLFTCASVYCTKECSDEEKLCGYPIYGEEGQPRFLSPLEDAKPEELSVDALPKEWPRHWNPGEFSFPEVYPLVPVNFGKAPEEEGLWDVLSFICGGGSHGDF